MPGSRPTAEPYIYDSASQTFYTYDDPASIALKGQYIWHQNLRGVMVWSLDGDTANGQLTTALGNSLGVSSGIGTGVTGGEGDTRQ